LYFNPRARKERDFGWVIDGTPTQPISIHAPVKSATFTGVDTSAEGEISIHAPVKSATASIRSSIATSSDFNPRARKERDSHDTESN